TSKSPLSFVTCNRSPTRTSRAALAGCPLERILPSSQARAANARVLKNLAAQSHLSIRTLVMIHFPEESGFFGGMRSAAPNAIYPKVSYRSDSSNFSPSASDPDGLSQ